MIYGLYGASGFGTEVMPLLARAVPAGAQLVFVDDGNPGRELNGYPVLKFDDFAAQNSEKHCSIAIADSAIREKLVRRCAGANIRIVDVQAANVVVGDNVEVGKGSILCSFVHLTSNLRIGVGFHCNIYSYVAHDCVVGDFVTFAPAVKCNGNVHIGDHAYIGTGAILRQGRPDKPLLIGTGAVIGMGAVVTKDVPAGETWVGNPARPLTKG